MYNTTPKDGQDELSYLWDIGQAKDSGVYEGTWDDIAYLMNFHYRGDESEYRTSSAYRKPYEHAKKFFEHGVFGSITEDEYASQLMNSKRELERAKIQFRDERRAWNKQNYIDDRAEDTLDRLSASLIEISKEEFPNFPHAAYTSSNDMIVVLSDMHIGADFSGKFGTFNTSIASERMGKFLARTLELQRIHHAENCYVLSLGDQISGNIHRTLQVSNKENVIEQIKIATQLISSFCYELSQNFNEVTLISVSGNHSRLTDKKEDAMHDERLDDVISWAVGLSLYNVDNFSVMDNDDTSIATFAVRGKPYVATHGDYDGFNKNDAQRLVSMIREFPEAWFTGHLHTIAVDEVNGIKMIRGGSLRGAGDGYTVGKRLRGDACQLVCIAGKDGLLAYYPINLE